MSSPQLSSAQKLQKAFAMVYSGVDTSAAQKIFKKSIKKHREIHAAYYGLGLCAMQSDPKDAFINFKKVDAKFRNSAKDFRKYMLDNYGITQDSAKFKMDEIAAVQLRCTIMNDSTERGFAAYREARKFFYDRLPHEMVDTNLRAIPHTAKRRVLFWTAARPTVPFCDCSQELRFRHRNHRLCHLKIRCGRRG